MDSINNIEFEVGLITPPEELSLRLEWYIMTFRFPLLHSSIRDPKLIDPT